MRIEFRQGGSRDWRCVGRADVDPAARPTRLALDWGKNGSDDESREVFLNWDGALDDAGRLRRCVVCGCGEMFHEKAFPRLTGIVIVLAFAGAAAGVLGIVDTPMLIAMTLLLIMDVAILVYSKRRLVCYRCRSSYHDLPIARYHRRWERAIAERYVRPEVLPAAAPTSVRSESRQGGTSASSLRSSDPASVVRSATG